MADEQPIELEEQIAGLKGQVADLARRERHCQMLRRMLDDLREEYLSLAQSAPDAIVSTDSRGRIVFWNQACKDLFGYDAPEVMGKYVTMLIPERYRMAHEDAFARAVQAGRALKPRVPADATALRKDGSEVPVEITHSSWKRGPDIFFAAFIRDITERKRYEKLKEDVERIIRHDLKSPLLGIVGFAKLLVEDESLPGKQREWAKLIYDSGMQMNLLLANSQAMLRIHEGSYMMDPKPVDVSRLLENLGRRFEPVLREKGVGLSRETERRGPRSPGSLVLGEEAFLDDMFSNLIKNAIEGSDKGDTVRLTVRRDGGQVFIDIHNRCVIPEEIRGRFFNPYVTSGKEGGTGLGAHSAHLIAKAHNGGITFTTSEEEGTHIIVRLPVATDEG